MGQMDDTPRGAVMDSTERLERLAADLAYALGGDDLNCVFQPIMDLRTGDIHTVEVLARWVHPDLGSIGPAEFVRIAEGSELIHALGRRVLEMAVDALRSFGDHGPAVSINVTARELAREDYSTSVLATLAAADVDAHRLVIELSESAFRQAPEAVLRTLRRLRAFGVRVAMDDLWSGLMAVTLGELPIDIVKLDGSVVDDLREDGDDVRVSTAIRMAKALAIELIAEEVETPHQCVRLLELGCQFAQGFALAPPGPASAIAARVREDEEMRALLI